MGAVKGFGAVVQTIYWMKHEEHLNQKKRSNIMWLVLQGMPTFYGLGVTEWGGGEMTLKVITQYYLFLVFFCIWPVVLVYSKLAKKI